MLDADAFLGVEDRPVPLRTRADLVFQKIGYQEAGYWVIKDPVALRYHRLQQEQYLVLDMLREHCTLSEIRDRLQKEYPSIPVRILGVQQLVSDLHEKNLLLSNRSGQGTELRKAGRKRKRKEVLSTLRSFLFLRLPGWDPEPLLNVMYPFCRWLFHPLIVLMGLLFALSGLLWVTVHFGEFQSRLPEFQQFFGWPKLMYLWCTIALAKIVHEIGHALTCKHFGGECHTIGLMILVGSPTLYCDVTDSWMLKNKWKRIAVGGAGAFVELILSAIAVYCWWFAKPGLFQHLCLNLFFVTTVSTVIFNLNPLIRFDGYYMLADYLEIPNLKTKANKSMQQGFAWYCLGIRMPEDPFMPEKNKFWFSVFAVASWGYRCLIMTGILFFLYAVLKPYGLQNIGLALSMVAIGTILYRVGKSVYKILSLPRNEPMSRSKVAITSIVAMSLLVGFLAIPVPWWINSSFLLEPENVQHLYALENGTVQQVLIQPGETVTKGDILIQMESPELDDELLRIQHQIDLLTVRLKTAKALNQPDEVELAQSQIMTYEDQRQTIKDRIASLTIRAPIGGTVVSAERKPVEQRNPLEHRLPTWHGTVTEARNANNFVPAGTPLLSIAPNNSMQAVMYVDQDDRNDLKEGQSVLLRCYHLPERIYKGTIASLSHRQVDVVPKALSNKAGGELPTVTDSQGREMLTSAAYQATVILQEETELMKTGMQGRARFIIDRRSIGGWAWRYIWQTFNFRI